MTFYGTDRLFVTIPICPGCGNAHVEMELKRVTSSDPEHAGQYKARCLYAKRWVYFPADYAES